MRGGVKRCVGPADFRADVPTCDMQQVGEDRRKTRASPSLPRGNRLVARTKTSPGFGRSGPAFPGTDPVAGTEQGRSMLRPSITSFARYSGGAAPELHRL